MAVPPAPASSCVSSCRHPVSQTIGGSAQPWKVAMDKAERAVGGPWGKEKYRDHTQNRAILSDSPTSSVEA